MERKLGHPITQQVYKEEETQNPAVLDVRIDENPLRLRTDSGTRRMHMILQPAFL
jgi:hypothetical protein